MSHNNMDFRIKNLRQDFKLMLNDVEQLKQLVSVLLHFKYVTQLVFVRKNLSLDFNIGPEFEEDIEWCFDQFNTLADSCIFSDFIRKQQMYYAKSAGYCSFKQLSLFSTADGGHEDLMAGQHDGPSSGTTTLKQLPDSIVDTIITEQNHELLLGPSTSHQGQHQQSSALQLQQRPNSGLGDEYSSNDASQGSFNRLLGETSHRFNLASELQASDEVMPGGGEEADGMSMMADETGAKALYANLLDLLPKSNQVQSDLESTVGMSDSAQTSMSGSQKRIVIRQTSPFKPSNSSSLAAGEQPSSSKYAHNEGSATESAVKNAVMESMSADESETIHVENELLQVEYWCSYEGCRFKSKSLTQVKAHEERRHIRKIVKCAQDGCASFFDTKDDLNEHVTDIHAGPQYKCALDVCSLEFQSDFRLKQHIREQHQEEYLTCKVCNKKFKTRKYLTRHIRNVHPKEKIADELVNTLNSLDSKSNPMSCTIDNCDKKFVQRSKLRQHIKEQHTTEYLTCNFCDKVCKTRNNLTNHLWISHQSGDYRCTFDDCDFTSTYRKHLLNHKKLRHQRLRKCPMDECGEMIPITRYQRHMSSFHKIKKYACSWPDCAKHFADHNALKNHVRIHLNFKRYRCKWPECRYASEQRFTVITHIRVCHFKLPRTKKKQMELNISQDPHQNPYDYLEVCREDICI